MHNPDEAGTRKYRVSSVILEYLSMMSCEILVNSEYHNRMGRQFTRV
jgi:hypothetical protein